MPIMYTLTKENAADFAEKLEAKFKGVCYEISREGMHWRPSEHTCRLEVNQWGIDWHHSFGTFYLDFGDRIAIHDKVTVVQSIPEGELCWTVEIVPCV